MSDFEFEARLERMFAQAPAVSNPNGFAERVEQRLERGGRLRNFVIAGAGVGGGVFAASQTIGSEMLTRLGELRLPAQAMGQVQTGSLLTSDGLATLSAGGEVIWMAGAMLALTVGFLATRFADVF
jgi:hypothetical protein